jgi:signal transduction histidine kinase
MTDRTEGPDKWLEMNSRMAKLIVHDLRNPISTLLDNLKYISKALLDEDEELRGAISDSMLAAEMLLRFSNNLQLIACLENNEKVEMGEIAMDAFVRESVERNKKMAEAAFVQIEVEDPVARMSCAWQSRYADLLIDNLIMSAVRNSREGNRVIVSATRKGGDVRVCVRDQGYAISREFIGNLLTREGQTEAKNRLGSRYGIGLGLYAAGLAAAALEGRIDIDVGDGWNEFAFVVSEKSRSFSR